MEGLALLSICVGDSQEKDNSSFGISLLICEMEMVITNNQVGAKFWEGVGGKAV